MDCQLQKLQIVKVVVVVQHIVVYRYGKIKNMMAQNVIYGQQVFVCMQCYVVVYRFKVKIVIHYMQIY